MITCPECGASPLANHRSSCSQPELQAHMRLERNPEVKERLKAATARMDDAVELDLPQSLTGVMQAPAATNLDPDTEGI